MYGEEYRAFSILSILFVGSIRRHQCVAEGHYVNMDKILDLNLALSSLLIGWGKSTLHDADGKLSFVTVTVQRTSTGGPRPIMAVRSGLDPDPDHDHDHDMPVNWPQR